jgi:deoxyribodipyrimidine photo-lyase
MPDHPPAADQTKMADAGEAAAPDPTRAAGLARLAAFVPRAGRLYAAERNHDRGAGRHDSVSGLSPYLRHRLVLEREVLAATIARWAPSTAQKFVSEVYWRTYFKGFLERRPTIWHAYRREVDLLQEAPAALRRDIAAAEAGTTGIDAFDHWARELVETGYLHNHARMWFASIWIFTLRLPWQAGADVFLRHLLDGDPASNTLSWRWVAGLHTRGRSYRATADNIARYTDGRFAPAGLAATAEPLTEADEHPLRPAPAGDPLPDGPALLLLTEEDCAAETLVDTARIAGAVAASSAAGRSPAPVAAAVTRWTEGALADAAARVGGSVPNIPLAAAPLADAARQAGVDTIVTPYVPVGPAADALAAARGALSAEGMRVATVLRPEDAAAWPHAGRGFFQLRERIGELLPAAPAARL